MPSRARRRHGGRTGGKRQANVSDVKVPDERLDKLAALFSPKKLTHASVIFKDLPLEHGEDGGITAASLADVRRADAVAIVVRAFKSDAVMPALKDATPLREMRKVMDSLVFGDYEIAEKRLARLDKEAKRDTREYKVLQQIVDKLGVGQAAGPGILLGRGPEAVRRVRLSHRKAAFHRAQHRGDRPPPR